MTQSKAEYLPEAINKTRLARIQTERRLLFYDYLGKTANAAFACWTALFALFAFIFPDSKWLAFVTVGASVTLAIISACTSAQNFGVRAAQMRTNYIGLHELWLKLDSEDAKQNPDEYADMVGEHYLQLLLCSENHTEGDYKRACQARPSNATGNKADEPNGAKSAESSTVVIDESERGTVRRATVAAGERTRNMSRWAWLAKFLRKLLVALVALAPALLALILVLLYKLVEHACV